MTSAISRLRQSDWAFIAVGFSELLVSMTEESLSVLFHLSVVVDITKSS